MSEEDRLKTNNEKVTINDYYYYYLLKCEDALNELEKYINERFNVCKKCQIASFKEHNNYSAYNGELLAYESILDKLKELKEDNK